MSETQKKSDLPAVGWDDLIRKTKERVEHLGLTLGATKEVITALVETVVEELGNDQRVRLKGLGTLTPRLYGGHMMNTPNIGEPRAIKKQRVIRFNQSRIASQAINAKPLPGEKKAKKKDKAAKAEATEEAPKKAKAKAEVEAPAVEAPKKAKAVKAETAPSEEPKKAKKAKPEAEEAPKKAKKAKPVDEDEDEDEE
jgi:nucleoid DNA-binding protein